MKIVESTDKSYSWLEWPVKLKGLAPAHKPHITCKFFGTASIDPKIVERATEDIKPYIPWRPHHFLWETRIWNTTTYVLRLTRWPEEMERLHRQFALIKDQFIPWNPHITVPKAYFYLVEDQAFTPENCELEIGEITLCLGLAEENISLKLQTPNHGTNQGEV